MYFTWIFPYIQKLSCKYGRTQIRIQQKLCKSSPDLLQPARSEFTLLAENFVNVSADKKENLTS